MTFIARILNRSGARPIPWASLLLGSAALVIGTSPAVASLLEYDRSLIAGGQLWRILTCQWTHISAGHLFWDVLSFVGLGVLCECASRKRFRACVLSCTLLIPAAVWVLLPDLARYRGLSGIDWALFALLAALNMKDAISARSWRWVVAIIALTGVLAAKIVYELISGSTIFVYGYTAAMAPVPLAHCIGAAVGLFVAFVSVADGLSPRGKKAPSQNCATD